MIRFSPLITLSFLDYFVRAMLTRQRGAMPMLLLSARAIAAAYCAAAILCFAAAMTLLLSYIYRHAVFFEYYLRHVACHFAAAETDIAA